MIDRIQRLRLPIDRSAKILEVGSSFSPTTPKSEGWQSFIVDHTTKEGLIEKYKHNPSVNISNIETVDFVWQEGYLHESLPKSQLGTFDACIASHVIEHIPDLVGFFKSLEKILCPEGVVSLALPDKRFCFDYFKPFTTTGDLLAAHAERRMRHTPKTAFDDLAYGVRNNSQIAWGQQPPDEFSFVAALADAKRMFDAQTDPSEAPYVDFHAWFFTPASFELIALELGVLGVIDFHLVERFPTEGPEFFAVLRRGRPHFASDASLQQRRLALLKGTVMDTREQIGLLLDNRNDAPPLIEGFIRRLDEQTVLIRQLHEQTAHLRDIAEVAAWTRKLLRPLRAGWLLLLPIRRSIARLRGRV